ncbi:STAS domain-containing protein [Actinoplanes sp. DH11]|uniref:STAS domain-containing protein n=1 Tax=Actinoplanes sp. DH11 TaxID=2857011 RepID=UPI001E527AF8|nr:STAS domain-containing protein [Actinoplanes sp. DH11]
MSWSAIKMQTGDRVVRVDLIGDVRSPAAPALGSILVQVVGTGLLDELVVGLHAVSGFDVAAVSALMAGYGAAVEHGTSYRVVGAHGRVRHVLQRTGMSDVLADSDDLGALILAVLLRPAVTRFR